MKETFAPKLKSWGIAAAAIVLLLVLLQFVSSPVGNPPVSRPIKAPADVVKILHRTCYRCHSNETKLGWYDRVAPASWLIGKDVRLARSRFNFSTWDTLSNTDQQGRLWEMVNVVLAGKMPLPGYAFIHPESRLSPQEIDVLKKYVNGLSPAKYHDTALIRHTAVETEQFKREQVTSISLPVASNGVKYVPDYQTWQVISTTNRFDNHSIRVVYGNSVTVKAIRQNHIHPFPDGSTIVKVVWNSIEEKNGDILPGSLNSVQIMTKDDRRFPDSQGWGFAKFLGVNLKPYGDSPQFNATCFNCHKIASENGYVFNIPLENKDLK